MSKPEERSCFLVCIATAFTAGMPILYHFVGPLQHYNAKCHHKNAENNALVRHPFDDALAKDYSAQ